MTAYRGADSKREEFRKYLEKAGVLDALTKVLVGLYEEPEKPNNALDFLKQHLGASGPDTADVEALKLEVTELRQKVETLQDQNSEYKAKLQQYEPPQGEEQAPDS
ncbi:MYCBP-like protein [Mya arenaria]|uniref:MYCBP-like protein n=1 Tax=Mya arenaria TaxID=6604 RepID=A0ABY7EAI5_MYAAR|nr:c-Myc-binding protein-like [Mya arenaria]WAR06855.1 MYCBP-like protein [Mya arenaria]